MDSILDAIRGLLLILRVALGNKNKRQNNIFKKSTERLRGNEKEISQKMYHEDRK